MGGGGHPAPRTTSHSYSARVCSFVQFCSLSFSVVTAWKKVLYYCIILEYGRRYYIVCIYSGNSVRSILVLKTGSGDNTYLIHYHFFVTSTLCKVDRNCLQNRQLRKRLWSRSSLTFISFFYHEPLFASILRNVNNFAAWRHFGFKSSIEN